MLRIAITSVGPSMDDEVDERFGRAPYVLIVDTHEGLIEAMDNHDNLNAVQGAGINTAGLMADKGVQWILTGHVGPKAFQVLEKAGIKVSSNVQGSCREVCESFAQGELEHLDQPDVKSHWG